MTKQVIRWVLLVAVAICLAAPQLALAASGPTVLVVPVDPTNSTSPHTTYPTTSTTESNIILGATVPSASGSTDSFTVTWVFGDGSANANLGPFLGTATTAPYAYDISVAHQYPASSATGTAWTATVTVKDTTAGTSTTVNYYVIQEANNLASRVNVAIDWGLWYMHQTMWRTNGTPNSGGWDTQTTACNTVGGNNWDCSYYGVIDAANVQAFEVAGHLQNGPASDPYTDDVYRGINRMLTFIASQAAASDTYTYNPATSNYICQDGSVPTTGDPTCSSHGGEHQYNSTATSCPSGSCVVTYDANSNGLQAYSNDGSGEYSYTTAPFLEALIASGTPNATATTGAYAAGKTYKTIVQDMLDFYGYSQYGSDTDVNVGQTRGASQSQGGAWLYGPQQGDDNSTSQWAAISFISGSRGFGISVPALITDTNNVWVTNSQDLQQPAPTGTDSFLAGDDLGAYGYRGSWDYSQEWGPFAMTPSGTVQMALDGVGRTKNTVFGDATTDFDQRWNNSETFYADNFCNAVNTYGNGGYDNAYYAPRAYMYGMYSFTKSMLEHNVGGSLQPIQYLRTLTPNVFTGNPDVPTNTIDWYAALSSANGGKDACDGVAQTLVTYQQNPASGTFDGHWYGFTADVGSNAQSAFETSWALIMLKKTVFVSCINNLVGRGTPGNVLAAPRIDLTWSVQTNATSYAILRGTKNGGPYVQVGTSTATAFSDRTPGLINTDTYYYVVQPIINGAEICQSNQATITIP